MKRNLSPILVKCKCCGRMFHPSVYHVHCQDYCYRELCRDESGRASSRLSRENKKKSDPDYLQKESARVSKCRRRNASRRQPVSLEIQLQSLLRLLVGLLSHMSGGDELGMSHVEELFRSLQRSGGSLTENSDFFQQNFGCT